MGKSGHKAKKRVSRKLFGVTLRGNEVSGHIRTGNFREVHGIGRGLRGGEILFTHVIKKPLRKFANLMDPEHHEHELKNWEKLGKIIPVPQHIDSIEHPEFVRVDVYEYAGEDLDKKHSSKKFFNDEIDEKQFIREHEQAITHIIRVWKKLGIVLDAKPANFTDGVVQGRGRIENKVHYVDEGVSEMAGTKDRNATQKKLGAELGNFLAEMYVKEYTATGSGELTQKLITKAKRLLKRGASSNNPQAIREMMRVFNDLKKTIEKTPPIRKRN